MFEQKNIDKNEVNILFCEALNCNLNQLLTKQNISKREQKLLFNLAKKRLSGMPIQKIFKRAYFYGYDFYVNKNVLCPRPETELLVEECLNIAQKGNKILDLCTGSGAIAVSLKNNLDAKVFASDISSKALYVAKKNARNYNLDIKFIKSNLFERISEKFDIIISNPPYIPSNDIENLDVEVKKYDPIISLDGGDDGLDFYKLITNQAKKHLNPNGKILFEVGKGQAKFVSKILNKNGFACYIKKDYNNIERIVVGEIL